MAKARHAIVASGPNDPDAEISTNAWNADHVVEDIQIADVEGLAAALLAKLDDTDAGQFAPSGHVHGDATTAAAGFMSGADKTKLDTIAPSATANAADAQLRDRSTHTGVQAPTSLQFSTTARFLGRSDAGAGPGQELTGDQVVLLLPTFTTSIRGLVPAPGSATGKTLHDDGTWKLPTGGSSDPLVLATENAETAPPSIPATGIKLFAMVSGGQRVPSWRGPDGEVKRAESRRRDIVRWAMYVQHGASTFASEGQVSSMGFAGTDTNAPIANTTYLQGRPRQQRNSGTTANAHAEFYNGATNLFKGGVGGGFDFSTKFGTPLTHAGQRLFAGIYAHNIALSSIIGSGEPSTLGHCIGLGKDSGDTAISIFHNDGAGACTKTSLPNSGVLANNTSYRLSIYSPSGAGASTPLYVHVTRIAADGTETHDEVAIATDLLALNAALGNRVWANNAASGADVAVTFTDFICDIEG